jgi:hypothetical protein
VIDSVPEPPPAPTVARELAAGLHGIGTGRFAAVIDDRLYLVDEHADAPGLIALPEGHPTIDDQRAASVLVTTYAADVVVATRPVQSSALAVGDAALPPTSGTDWWVLRPDGTLHRQHDATIVRPPPGFRAYGTLDDGFVGLQAPDDHWVYWAPRGVSYLARSGYEALAGGLHTVAFKHECGDGGCVLSILHVDTGEANDFRLAQVPEFATFSPDGSRLAFSSTLGRVYVIDVLTGDVLVDTEARGPVNDLPPARTFAWTPDGAFLLIVSDPGVEVRRASDGGLVRQVGIGGGLEQVVALP